jgi:hypothetical protein
MPVYRLSKETFVLTGGETRRNLISDAEREREKERDVLKSASPAAVWTI